MANATQARGRATRTRILAATRKLLDRFAFDALTLQQILRAARCSIGSFYHQFPDKEALLPALYADHAAEIEARLTLESTRIAGDLAARTRALVAAMADLHRAQRGLLRTLVLRSHAAAGGRRAAPSLRSVVPRLAALLTTGGGIRRACPDQAARLGLLMVLGVLREVYLFPHSTARDAGIDEQGLIDELSTALLAYLSAA